MGQDYLKSGPAIRGWPAILGMYSWISLFLYIWLLKPKEISMVIVQSGVAFEISLKISN